MTARKVSRLALAQRVCGWASPLETETKDGLERSPEHIYLANTSGEPVFELVAYLVYVQGAAASTGEEVESFLVSQRELYAPQLTRYARALRAVRQENLSVRLGLYYPRIAAFDWWVED